ncbi:hypothetical protein BH11MYX3_BH11MYX3_30550 [soil metagenome]
MPPTPRRGFGATATHSAPRGPTSSLSVLIGFVFLPFLVGSRGVAAQPAPIKAEAQALFDEGQRLLRAGEVDRACATFEASLARVAGLGTRGKLAECYERAGRIASAWAQWREVAARAHQDGDPRREEIATERVTALEPRLARLTITAPAGVHVRRDGGEVDPAAFGVAIAVDPGHHVLEGHADGFVTWHHEIDLVDGAQQSLQVPTLLAAAVIAPRKEPRAPTTTPRSALRLPAVIAVAGGGALIIAGGLFGLRAHDEWSDAEDHCPSLRCDPTGLERGDAARRDARRADYLVGGGALLAAAGAIVWWRTHGERTVIAPALSTTVLGLDVQGRF